MPHVITTACIDVKDGACVHACPVDCIYVGGRMLYIQPDECIDCGVCISFCPVEAIYDDTHLPPELTPYLAINRDFFGPSVTTWGAPGGASPKFTTDLDHPAVAAHPKP